MNQYEYRSKMEVSGELHRYLKSNFRFVHYQFGTNFTPDTVGYEIEIKTGEKSKEYVTDPDTKKVMTLNSFYVNRYLVYGDHIREKKSFIIRKIVPQFNVCVVE